MKMNNDKFKAYFDKWSDALREGDLDAIQALFQDANDMSPNSDVNGGLHNCLINTRDLIEERDSLQMESYENKEYIGGLKKEIEELKQYKIAMEFDPKAHNGKK